MNLQSKLLMLASAAVFMPACDDDETSYSKVDGLPPTIEMASDLQAEPGRKFLIEAVIKDNDGIRSINLKNEKFCLDKTINLLEIKDELVKEYNLSYNYTPSKEFAETEKMSVIITVEDVLGKKTQQTLEVSMDGDFTNPSFSVSPSKTISVLLKENTRLKLNFTAVDDKALDKVVISMPALEVEKEITEFENAKEFAFSEYIDLPSKVADYEVTITLYDKSGHEETLQSVVNVAELPDFEKMYLADVEKASELNSDLFGVPMLISHVDAYTYVAEYYCSKPNTGVCFIPQKKDFEPICFGPSKDDAKILGDSKDATDKIVLEEKGYYRITFNTKAATYSVEKFEPEVIVPTGSEPYKQVDMMNSNPIPQGKKFYLDDNQDYLSELALGLAGAGFPSVDSKGRTVGNWSTAAPLLLDLDPENPYLFTAEIDLEAESFIEFTISPYHDWGWWFDNTGPFWRFESGADDSHENEYNTRNGGNNMTKTEVKKSGRYKFTFDTYLLRSKFVLVE